MFAAGLENKSVQMLKAVPTCIAGKLIAVAATTIYAVHDKLATLNGLPSE